MRAVVQRVRTAAVEVDGETIAEIGCGLLVLVGVTHTDADADADWLAAKLAHLRIFEDAAGKMNASLLDVGGQALIVSQFTLYGDARKGRRPSFTTAAPPELARPLVDRVVAGLRTHGIPAQTGRFGARMNVCLCNDGPVTLLLETEGRQAAVATGGESAGRPSGTLR